MSRISKGTMLTGIAALLSTQAHAAGFQVAEHSASGLGRAYAGEAAMTDNASTMARNPSTMTQVENTQISAALHAVFPNIDVTDNNNKQTANNVAPDAFIPASYAVFPISDEFSAGIGLYTVYGVGTDYPDDFATGYMAGDTALTSVNLNPAIAYQVDEKLSIGAGLNVVYAIAELNRHFGQLALFTGPETDKLISMEGKTWSFGWNIGALYEVDENTRFGASYRSPVKLKFKDGEFTDYAPGGRVVEGGGKVKGELNIELPAIAELSGFHQLNPSWALHYSVLWTEWSVFEELKATSAQCTKDDANGVCFSKTEKYDNALRWSAGTTYSLNDTWTLRAGLALDEQAGESTLSIPDTDRFWYSAGATYQVSASLSVDGGLSYVSSKSGDFNERLNTALPEYNYSAKGSAIIVGLQATIHSDNTRTLEITLWKIRT
ncbi:long-chain fatty acid transporter [Veronia nyctiphanis]|uniref:Long-chain fatty acid transporter n=1 Tax=Veronia nyctiphanis TaxID=1278244 RepID=A0A4Q0YSG6_9GAMM|nr:outer membrane protein transport protein [Veronia nyctiphanis]RXJ73613.1 long-chain fatty acid transporter [Veronia nyctiphanis]